MNLRALLLLLAFSALAACGDRRVEDAARLPVARVARVTTDTDITVMEFCYDGFVYASIRSGIVPKFTMSSTGFVQLVRCPS